MFNLVWILINKDYVHQSTYLDKYHPPIKYIKIEGNGLAEIAQGKLFGAIGSSVEMNYDLTKNYKNRLKVMTDYPDSYIEGGIGVHIDEPILLSILSKAVASIDTVKQEDIFDKWINEKYVKIVDYRLVWQIVLLSFILISITLFWNRRLNSEIKKRKVIEINLKVTQENLSELNDSLEEKVKVEIEKNKKHQLIMMEQTKLAQMGEMIGNIAHQWRQPLAQINSSILIIDVVLKKNGFINELINTKLLEIEDLTEYMSNTIDNFQHFFNTDKEKNFFFLREIIDKSMTILKGAFSSNFTIVQINVDETLEIKGFPLELQQVLVVLLSNANDALKTRKIQNPKIIVDIEEYAETYILSISDNAGGIKIEKLEQVFEPYYTTKHKSQGTGVGLYMAKMIIEEGMKGKLSVENKNNGACFSIEILKEKNNE